MDPFNDFLRDFFVDLSWRSFRDIGYHKSEEPNNDSKVSFELLKI